MDQRGLEAITQAIFARQIDARSYPFLHLTIRREFLVQDSLRQLADRLGTPHEFKKRIQVTFAGEEGVDAGGLTKEWFQLIVRDLFAVDYGMFTGGQSILDRFLAMERRRSDSDLLMSDLTLEDPAVEATRNQLSAASLSPKNVAVSYEMEDNNGYLWFTPVPLDGTTEEYHLAGVVFGLSIHNSTLLDVRFPGAVYRKLRGLTVGLADLEQFRPELVRGLRNLLSYPGDDVESVFCQDFIISYREFGQVITVPLLANGDKISVTNTNRAEFVDKTVDWILNKSIALSFEAFSRGFWTVLSGNALELLHPEEIECLVCGSSENLDVGSLKSVTEYEGFDPNEVIIQSFWEILEEYPFNKQREFLTFVTGTDRIPASGTSAMTLKISCLGPDCERFPIAHTCFNQLMLYRYSGKAKLFQKLSRAISESAGFGLK